MVVDKHSLFAGFGVGALCGALAVGYFSMGVDSKTEDRLLAVEAAVEVVGGESYDVPGMRESLARGVEQMMKSTTQIDGLRRRLDSLESEHRLLSGQYAAHLQKSDVELAEIRELSEKAAGLSGHVAGATVESLILKSVSQSWQPPKSVTDAMSAVLDISVSANGAFTNATTVVSSGNPEFDNSIIQALRSAGGVADISRLNTDQQALLSPHRMTFTSSNLSPK